MSLLARCACCFSRLARLAWVTQDGHYLYFLRIVGEPVICRIRLSDRGLEEVVGLKNLRCTGIMGGICWVGLAPDDSPLLLRDIGIEEIYALDWQAP